MIKRVLLTSLLLFIPLFARAGVLVIGENIKERNIPFKLDVMEKAFNNTFNYAEDYENIKKVFYTAVNNSLSMPFSMEDLAKICWESIPEFSTDVDALQCLDFVETYINEIAKISEKNTKKPQNLKTCEKTDPDDRDFTLCCIAQDAGVAKWDPYTRVCSCKEVSKKWNPINGTCDNKADSSCEKRYPGNFEAVSCCQASEAFWNDVTGECRCFDENKIWDSNVKKCVSAYEYRKNVNSKYVNDLREPWQEYQPHGPISSKM